MSTIKASFPFFFFVMCRHHLSFERTKWDECEIYGMYMDGCCETEPMILQDRIIQWQSIISDSEVWAGMMLQPFAAVLYRISTEMALEHLWDVSKDSLRIVHHILNHIIHHVLHKRTNMVTLTSHEISAFVSKRSQTILYSLFWSWIYNRVQSGIVKSQNNLIWCLFLREGW